MAWRGERRGARGWRGARGQRIARGRRGGGAGLPALLAGALALVVAASAVAGADASAGSGLSSSSSSSATPPTLGATGYFHTAQSGGRWWLVAPDGSPFYASAVDHVTTSPDVNQNTGVCPYCQTVAQQYPVKGTWAAATAERLRSWGFNALGAFSDYATFAHDMPYTDLITMASGNDWFAPTFVTHADQVAATSVAPLATTPNLIGWYTDSELHWGPDWRSTTLVLNAYLALPTGSPGRTVAESYTGNPNGFVYALATRYFQVTTAAIRRYDPHHLILGVKAPVQLIQPQLLEAAKPYVDVFSVDDYALVHGLETFIQQNAPQYLDPAVNLANIEAIVQKPIIIGEYGFRAAGAATPNTWPPIFPIFATQTARAAAYRSFVTTMYHSPWVVGDSWFEYVDEPVGGRQGDGENSNWGLVGVNNLPYQPVVAAARALHRISPQALAVTGPHCGSWQTSPTGVTCNVMLGTQTTPSGGTGTTGARAGTGSGGPGTYRLVERTGATFTTGQGITTPPSGVAGSPVVGGAADPAGPGTWMVTAAGQVVAEGGAPFLGSLAGRPLAAPVVGMAATPTGGGYWLVAADGGVFAFGDARFAGSLPRVLAGRPLAAPVVGMAATPTGGGYWLVAADGGVFAFGDAPFVGSPAPGAGRHLAAPVVGLAATPTGGGYWLVAADGGVFALGDARFTGSLPQVLAGRPLAAPVVGMAATPTGGGYWLVAADGGVFAFGDAAFSGSMAGTVASGTVVGVVAAR